MIGPNGTGKTTLFRMIVGQEQPDAGVIELGQNVVLSYVDQHRDALNDENTIFEEITGGKDQIELGDVSMNSRAYVARFNFRGPQQQKKVGQCSGGERNRIHLAKMLRRGGNLDPPGRADQRPRRQHDAGAGAGAGRVSRLRHGDQPRPLLPRPRLHPPAR